MKKVWIGEGITILLIIIASIIAHKLLPDDRALPLGVFSVCLCLFILAVTVAVIILSSLFQEIKGTRRKRKKDISGIVVMVIIILIWLAGTITLGIRVTRALKDTINGPVEQPIHNTSLKKRHVYRYRRSSTDRYYLYCYTLDEKNELLKVRVNEEKLDKVDTTMLVGSYICESIYGLEEDRYMLYYYENLKFLVDLEVMKVKPE